MGRTQAAQVVGGLETTNPGQLVGFVELLAGGLADVDVQALRLVDPLLAAGGGFDQPARVDFEGGGVKAAQFGWNTVDLRDEINNGRLQGPRMQV